MIGEFCRKFPSCLGQRILSRPSTTDAFSRFPAFSGISLRVARRAFHLAGPVALIGYTGMAFIPFLAFIRSAKLAENSVGLLLADHDHRHALSPDEHARPEVQGEAGQRYAFFDARFGDVLSAGLVFAGTRWLSFGSKQFALVNVALIEVWLASRLPRSAASSTGSPCGARASLEMML